MNSSIKDKITKKMAAAGLSVAASLSAGYLLIPHEGEVKNSKGEHVVYLDPVGIPTFCWGLTGKDMYGKFPKVGDTYTDQECEIMFSERVRHFEKAVDRNVSVKYASVFQKAALISFTYNVGEGALASSTLLRELNKGNHEEACDQLLRWIYAKGIVLPGLKNRRGEERDWCSGDAPYEATATVFSLSSTIIKETYTINNSQ